jgi:hypothetical protein
MNEKLNKLFEENIKNNLKSKNYVECISLLKIKINEIFTYKIKKQNKNFRYTCLEDLLDIGTSILSTDDAMLLNEYYLTIRKNLSNEYIVARLMEIYKKIK